MTPETIQNEKNSYGIDYFNLGAVLFEMVTGLQTFY